MNGTDHDAARTAVQASSNVSPPVAPAPEALPRPVTRFVSGPDPRRRSPWLAGLLSLMPGLGQIYVGYYRRGITQFLTFALLLLFISNEFGGDQIVPVVAIGMAFLVFYAVIDAMRRATLYNMALTGIEEIEMPRDFEWPAMTGVRGSIFGGSVLVFVGLSLFLHTRFDVPLDWIAEWWPLAITIFGAYLVYRAIQDRGAGADDARRDRPDVASSDS